MIFNSITFILFLIFTVILYWSLPERARLWMLSLSSLLFYGFWRFEFIPLLLIAAGLDYWVSNEIYKRDDRQSRKRFLILSLVINLGILFYFKYLVFFLGNVEWVLHILGFRIEMPHLNIILPLAISFYTFETISYTVDVYRGQLKPERNFLVYLTFLVYYPHLIAGPIMRASDILPQLRTRKTLLPDCIVDGIKRVLIGLFLKVFLADNIAELVNSGFQQPASALSALDIWTLSFLFGFQIYFDFAGYSHIAIGCAKMMGIHIRENFDFPYMAKSPQEFWQRWHISLSSWIRDYVFLPVAYSTSRKLKKDKYFGMKTDHIIYIYATSIAFALCGFWHGANWNFLIWGLYWALLLIVHQVSRKVKVFRAIKSNFASWVFWLPLFMIGWLPFRVQNFGRLKQLSSKLFKPTEYLWLGLRENNYLIAVLLLGLVTSAYFVSVLIRRFWEKKSGYMYYLFESLGLAIVIVIVFIFLRPISQFIYFQF